MYFGGTWTFRPQQIINVSDYNKTGERQGVTLSSYNSIRNSGKEKDRIPVVETMQ